MKNRFAKYRFNGEGDWNEIKYDPLGRVRERISADETPITKKFYSDGRQLIQQLDDSNNAEFDYLRGPTGLDRQWNESSEKRYFYIKDPLGTVWAMIESGFTPQQSPIIRLYNYNAWGEHIDASDINFPDYNSDPNLMRYIGCRVEAFGKGMETQRDAIYHLDHRHYVPGIARFAQRQIESLSVFNIIDSNAYNYCMNCPSILRDPSGLTSGIPTSEEQGLQPKLCTGEAREKLKTYNTGWMATCPHEPPQLISDCLKNDDWFCYCCCYVRGLMGTQAPAVGLDEASDCCFDCSFKKSPDYERYGNPPPQIGGSLSALIEEIFKDFQGCLCDLYNKGIITPGIAGWYKQTLQRFIKNCINGLCKGKGEWERLVIHLKNCAKDYQDEMKEEGIFIPYVTALHEICDLRCWTAYTPKVYYEGGLAHIVLCADCLIRSGQYNNRNKIKWLIAHELMHVCTGTGQTGTGELKDPGIKAIFQLCFGSGDPGNVKCWRDSS